MIVGKIWRHMLGTPEDLFIAINAIPQTQSGKKFQAVMDTANTHTLYLTLPVK